MHWETPDENDCHWRRAGRCGHAVLRDQITALINPNGEQYDSRAGIAGYYRYGPRNVAELCDDDEHQVKVPTVRVHPSAYDRLARWVRDYEPVSLKGPFTVGGVPQIPANPEALEQAWDIVWWRRLAYFITLGLTGFLLLFAVRLVIPQADFILDFTEARLGAVWSLVTRVLGATATGWIESGWSWLVAHVGSLLGWAAFIVPSFAKYPLSGLLALALLALVFFVWTDRLHKRIEVHAEWAWARQKGLPAAAKPKTDWYNAVARPLRPVTAWVYRAVWRAVLVNLLGIGLGVLALILLSPFWIWRVVRRRPWMA